MIRNVVDHLKTLWRRGGQEREGNLPAVPKPPPMALRNVDDELSGNHDPIHVSQGRVIKIENLYAERKSAWRGNLNFEDA